MAIIKNFAQCCISTKNSPNLILPTEQVAHQGAVGAQIPSTAFFSPAWLDS